MLPWGTDTWLHRLGQGWVPSFVHSASIWTLLVYESVLWDWWEDTIVNNIYLEFYLLNKRQIRKWRFTFPFYGLSKKQKKQLQTFMSLNGTCNPFHCEPLLKRKKWGMMAALAGDLNAGQLLSCLSPAAWLLMICCSVSWGQKKRIQQLVLWWSGVRWSHRLFPWWIL